MTLLTVGRSPCKPGLKAAPGDWPGDVAGEYRASARAVEHFMQTGEPLWEMTDEEGTG